VSADMRGKWLVDNDFERGGCGYENTVQAQDWTC
jgi:hypothetical protein